jgi:aminoglycoside phosphotransferase family enzyme/predicted kinase
MTTSTRAGYLRLVETHAAGVVLVGDLAFKFKKPVDFGFLDFTDPDVRAATCRREVELNRRFAPDVYLGVADLSLPDGAHESLVLMRRMPEERRLSTLVSRHIDVADDLRHLARRLATAHARCERGPHVDSEADLSQLRTRWNASLDQVRSQVPPVLEPDVVADIDRLTQRFLDGRRALFDRRIAEGRAVDGHGDLLCDDVFCLEDGPRMLDCLEFDDRLRYVDQLDDAAFLAMDLERLGHPELGTSFLAWYAEYSGDPAPPSLMHHYVAYRAFVRAKVACLRAGQGDRASRDEARALALLARTHLEADTVTMALVGGAPGSGKSTLAAALADRLGMVVVSADRVRKELAGLDPESRAAAPYGEGLYSPRHTERTYAEMLRRARVLLSLGESVVLDASWSTVQQRASARRSARDTFSDLLELCCQVPTRVSLDRVRRRAPASHVTSDADEEVARRMARNRDRWPEALVIRTDAPVEESVATVAALVRPGSVAALRRAHRPVMAPD